MKLHNQQKNEFGWMGILVAAIVIVAGVLRIFNWISPPSDLPLLVQAEGMVRVTSIDDPRLSNSLTRILPKETFGGSVHVIGLYPNGGTDLPKNSISVVYKRDGWRMMQIDLLPMTRMETVLGPFIAFRQETVAMPNNREARLIDIKTLLDCVSARSDKGIGSCRFTRLLAFEIEPGLVGRLAVDGEKVTDGELIMVARSMLNSIDDVKSR